MDSRFQNVAIILMVLKVLKADDLPDDTEACSNHTVISDRTRLFHYSQTLNNCDDNLAEGWYKFEVNGVAAQIPRICLKNNICGTRLPLRLDLGDQSLPTPNATVWAHVCTSFDILDKWDCCVLRQRAGIKNCGDYYVYHLRPTDRCNVGYCIQETGTNPSKEYTAKTGDYTHESASLVSPEVNITTEASNVNTTQTMPANTSQTENPCPQTVGFPCSKDSSRTCYNTTNDSGRHAMFVACSDGRGCGEACDIVGDCYDDSDEHANLCQSVVCNEGMQLCPDESACYISCDGRVDCIDGSDEQGCWQILESSAEPTSETVTGSTVSEEIYNSDTQEPSLTTTMPMTAELVFSTTVLQSVGSTVTRSISFADSVHTFESITPSFTSFSTSGSLSASTTGLTTTPGNSERFSNVFETPNATVAATVTSPLVLPTRPSEFSATISPEASSSIVRSTIVESSVETTNFISATETQPVQRSESLSESLLDLSVQISEVSSAISESTPPISSSVSISYSSVSAHRPDTSSVTPLLPSFTSVPSTNGFLPSTDVTENEATSLTPGDVVSSVFPTTASTATTADTMLTGPIILTFDIIGTAYRNVKETFEEPTFEELLQEAIAGVLNEYSNRNRRSVQNFTEDHIQVHNITFHTDNATVSVSVNSTKDGEEYVPASELETVFNNQSAMELLCQTLFGEPSTQTVAITSSTDVITSSFMSASTAQSTPSIERTAQVSSQVSSLMTSVQPSFTSFTERILPTASFASASREAISVVSGIILESIIESETITQSTPSVIPSATSDILSSMTLQSMKIRIPTVSSTEISVSEPTGTISEISSEILQTDNLTTAASSSTTILSEISRSVHTVETETPQPQTTMLSDSSESSPAAMITSSDAAQTVDMEMTLTMLSFTLEPSPAPVAISSEISETSSVLPTPSVSVNLSEATSQPSSSVSVQSTTSQLSSFVSKQSTTSVYMATSDSSTNIPMTSALLSAATATVEHSPTLAPSETIFTIQSRSPSSLSIQPVTDEYSQVLSDTVVEFSSESSSSLVTHSAAVQFSSSTGKAIAPTSSYSSPTPSVAHSLFSQNYTTSDTPLETETYTISGKDNATVGTLTIVTSTERNLTVEKPDIFVEEDTFQQNIGLFIFLIVAGTCIVGACLFALAGTIYRRRRRHTWDPRMAYQDAYADMEKANLSFHRDNLGIESPIPDIDILKGEPNEQETSLSKASTLTLPPTPKNEASQTDVTLDAGPSDDSRPFNQSYTSVSPRYDITTPDQAGRSGCENRGFEEDRDSGVDGIVPVDEIDNTYPRKEFPWIEQLADTRL